MYVYILKSQKNPNKTYIGHTKNFEERLKQHNSSHTKTTSPYKPWSPMAVIWVDNADKALRLEKYLKSGSGRAFTEKHLK